jgi:hypothetical protein
MGITDKVERIASQMQDGVKRSTTSIFGVSLKSFTSFMLAYTVALIMQEMMTFGNFAFVFIMVVVTSLVMRLLWNWSILQVLLFDLICVLVGLLLRMYILMAP